jgi:hypothetical protein
MCALCGVLGASGHWTDTPAGPGALARDADAALRRRERMRRVAAANRILKHYGLALADWQGSSFVLSTFTGKSEMVENLAHLWGAAERLLGRPCDPLDDELLASLEPGLG